MSVRRRVQRGEAPDADMVELGQSTVNESGMDKAVVSSVLEHVRTMTQWEILISHLQTMGVVISIDIKWPQIVYDWFSWLSLPFSLNFERISFGPVAVFYLKVLLPLLLYWCYSRMWTRPHAWKMDHIAGWSSTVLRQATYAILAGAVAFAVLYVAGTATSLETLVATAVAVTALAFATWYALATVTRIAFSMQDGSDDHLFFCKLRTAVQTGTFFLGLVLYLPIVQSIVEVIVIESGSSPVGISPSTGPQRVFNFALAGVAAVMYGVCTPLLLLRELRHRHHLGLAQLRHESSSRGPTSENDGGGGGEEERPKSTLLEMQSLSSEGVVVVDGGGGDDDDGTHVPGSVLAPRWDFLLEGSKAAEQERILAMLKATPSLKTDGSRARSAQHRHARHSAREAEAFGAALRRYKDSRGGDHFQRQTLPFDPGAYYWKAVQLGEKAALVVAVGFSSSAASAKSNGSGVLQLSLALFVAFAMLVISAMLSPYRDVRMQDGSVVKAPEDTMDVVARVTTVANLALAIVLVEASSATDAVAALLMLVNICNMLYLLYTMDVRDQLLEAYTFVKAMPERRAAALARRARATAESARRLREFVAVGAGAEVQEMLSLASNAQNRAEIIHARSTEPETPGNVIGGGLQELPSHWTALHVSAAAGDSAVMKLLLDGGGDVRVVDSEGRTPLHVAYHFGRGMCIELLLKYSADAYVLDDGGKRPSELLDVNTAAQGAIVRRSRGDMRWLCATPAFDGEDIASTFVDGEGGAGVMDDTSRAKWSREACAAKAWDVVSEILCTSNATDARLRDLKMGAAGFLTVVPAVLRPLGGALVGQQGTAPPAVVDLGNNALNSVDSENGDDVTDEARAAVKKLNEFLGSDSCASRRLDLRGNGIAGELAAALVEAFAPGGNRHLEWLNGLSLENAYPESTRSRASGGGVEYNMAARSPDLDDVSSLQEQLDALEAEQDPASGETWRTRLAFLQNEERMQAMRQGGAQGVHQINVNQHRNMRPGGESQRETREMMEAKEKCNKMDQLALRIRHIQQGSASVEMVHDIEIYETAFVCRRLVCDPRAASIVLLCLDRVPIGDKGTVHLAEALSSGSLTALRQLWARDGCQIGDDGAALLADALMGHRTSLGTAAPGNRVRVGTSAEPIAAGLEQLWLRGNAIGDRGVVALAKMLGADQGAGRSLTQFDISQQRSKATVYNGDNNCYTTDTLRSLAAAIAPGRAPNLKRLEFGLGQYRDVQMDVQRARGEGAWAEATIDLDAGSRTADNRGRFNAMPACMLAPVLAGAADAQTLILRGWHTVFDPDRSRDYQGTHDNVSDLASLLRRRQMGTDSGLSSLTSLDLSDCALRGAALRTVAAAIGASGTGGGSVQLAGAAATPWIAHLNLSGNLMRAADARWLANTFLKRDGTGAAGGAAAGGSLLVSLVLDGNRLLQPEGRGETEGEDGAGATPDFTGMQKSDADWSGLEALGAVVADAQSSLRLLSVRDIEGFDPERTQSEYLGVEYDEETNAQVSGQVHSTLRRLVARHDVEIRTSAAAGHINAEQSESAAATAAGFNAGDQVVVAPAEDHEPNKGNEPKQMVVTRCAFSWSMTPQVFGRDASADASAEQDEPLHPWHSFEGYSNTTSPSQIRRA